MSGLPVSTLLPAVYYRGRRVPLLPFLWRTVDLDDLAVVDPVAERCRNRRAVRRVTVTGQLESPRRSLVQFVGELSRAPRRTLANVPCDQQFARALDHRERVTIAVFLA